MGKLTTAVYFSPRLITIACGKLNEKTSEIEVIKKLAAPMPESAVVNGVINDEESLFIAFTAAALKFGGMSKVVLILDTTHIIYRLSVLPVVSAKHMAGLVQNGFINRCMADVEYIYDYAIIDSPGTLPKKQNLVLSCAVDAAIVETYKEFFKRVGVTLSVIDYSSGTILKAIANLPSQWAGKNAVLCVIDYYIVVIVNFLANGDINFFRSRILSTETDDNYFAEIGDTLYSYLQSRKSQNRNEEQEVLCVLDSNGAATAEDYTNNLGRLGFKRHIMGIAKLVALKGVIPHEADVFAYNLFALASGGGKRINFLSTHKVKNVSALVRAFFKAALAAALAAGALLYLYARSAAIQKEIDRYEAYILDPAVTAAVSVYNQNQAELEELAQTRAIIDQYAIIAAETVVMDHDTMTDVLQVLHNIGGTASISRIYFDSDKKSITLECFFQDAERVSAFVEGLRKEDIFADIVYNRYAAGSRFDNIAGYECLVECYVKEVKPVE